MTARVGICLRCGSPIPVCECADRAAGPVEVAIERITSAQLVISEALDRPGDHAVRLSRDVLHDLSLLHSLAIAQLRGVGKTT